MSDVKSKNLYELLGNDHEYDSDKEPEPPAKAIDKPIARSGKRDAPKDAPAAPVESAPTGSGGRGGGDRRRGGFTGNERAFRDRATGRPFNREQPTGETEEGTVRGRDGGPGTRGRGRGQRGPRRGGDRHVNRSGQGDHVKQGDQAWGAPTGEAELNDEKAGDAIAADEVKESGWDANADAPPAVDGPTGTGENGAEEEPEDTHKSYADYVAEQAAKKLEGLGLKEARAPNEGSKENKKWKGAKELVKDEEEAEYFKGEERARRERERTTKKIVVDIDYAFKEQPAPTRGGARGGRGRGRGDRGGERGERGAYRGRGDRAERGDRGDRGGDRGAFRGRGRGGDSTSVAINDDSAFPSLGGK